MKTRKKFRQSLENDNIEDAIAILQDEKSKADLETSDISLAFMRTTSGYIKIFDQAKYKIFIELLLATHEVPATDISIAFYIAIKNPNNILIPLLATKNVNRLQIIEALQNALLREEAYLAKLLMTSPQLNKNDCFNIFSQAIEKCLTDTSNDPIRATSKSLEFLLEIMDKNLLSDLLQILIIEEKKEIIETLFRHIEHQQISDVIKTNQKIIALVLNTEKLDINQKAKILIHYACLENDLELVKILLDKGADLNPLFIISVDDKHLAITQLLLDRGAKVDIEYDKCKCCPTALWHAALHDFHSVEDETYHLVSLLLKYGANANVSFCGHPILNQSIFSKKFKIANLLLQCNAQPNAYDNNGYTPLIAAITNFEMVQALLESGANPNQDSIVSRPLSNAIFLNGLENAVKIAKCLLEHGADVNLPFIVHKSNPIKPLEYAIIKNMTELVKLFLSHGAYSEDAYFLAIQHWNKDIIKAFMDHQLQYKLLANPIVIKSKTTWYHFLPYEGLPYTETAGYRFVQFYESLEKSEKNYDANKIPISAYDYAEIIGHPEIKSMMLQRMVGNQSRELLSFKQWTMNNPKRVERNLMLWARPQQSPPCNSNDKEAETNAGNRLK